MRTWPTLRRRRPAKDGQPPTYHGTTDPEDPAGIGRCRNCGTPKEPGVQCTSRTCTLLAAPPTPVYAVVEAPNVYPGGFLHLQDQMQPDPHTVCGIPARRPLAIIADRAAVDQLHDTGRLCSTCTAHSYPAEQPTPQPLP